MMACRAMSATSCSSISAKSLPLLQSSFGNCANTLYRRTTASQGSVSSSVAFLYSQLFPSRFSSEGVALLSTSRTCLQPSRTIYTRSSPRATVEVAAPPSTGVADDSSPAASPPERATWKANIDFKYIRDNKEVVIENCLVRKSTADVNRVVELYEDFLTKNAEVDRLRAERNVVANSMKGKLEPEKRAELVEEGKRLKELVGGLEVTLSLLTEDLQREGQRIPNATHPNVPRGGEESAVLIKEVGSQRQFSFPIKDHVDLGLSLDLIDFDSAAEVSGAKFYYLKNEAVLLEMALVSWSLSLLLARGFSPLSTPDLVRSQVLEKCGFQPRAANTQVYSIEGMDLCLAGTAEILVGGMHMDRILSAAQLPLKLVAFSHCFRTEAGAAGAATRGLYRVHQFSKLEIFGICTPEASDGMLEELIGIEAEMFAALGLHFKVLDMSSEDLGAPAYRKYDVEAWMPGLGRYGEISSASNCTDYQARRLNIRYRPPTPTNDSAAVSGKGGKKAKQYVPPTQFVHTLNATACAVPRMIIAILENYQQEDGSVVVPEVLRPFMGGVDVIRPKNKET